MDFDKNVMYHDHAGTYALTEHEHDEYAEHAHEHDEYVEHHECSKFALKDDTAKKGTANAALGLGIAGTALGAAALWKNGGGFLGGGRRGYEGYGYEGEWGYHRRREEREERHYDIRQAERISELQADKARCGAERYAEQLAFGNYKELSCKIESSEGKQGARITALEGRVFDNVKNLAVMQAKTEAGLECLGDKLNNVNSNLKAEFKAAFLLAEKERECCCNLEAERRKCGDDKIIEWVESHFTRNKKVIPAGDICPQVMPRYNSFNSDDLQYSMHVQVDNPMKSTAKI
jgi:hypothetical protein